MKGGNVLNKDSRQKYLSFEKSTRIICTRTGIYLTLDCRNIGGDVHFIEINNTSVNIIRSICRNGKTFNLVENVLKDMRLPSKYREIIDGFITHLFKQGFLKYISCEDEAFFNVEELYSDREYFLTHATIELTDRCNLMCKHCYMSLSSKNKKIYHLSEIC